MFLAGKDIDHAHQSSHPSVHPYVHPYIHPSIPTIFPTSIQPTHEIWLYAIPINSLNPSSHSDPSTHCISKCIANTLQTARNPSRYPLVSLFKHLRVFFSMLSHSAFNGEKSLVMRQPSFVIFHFFFCHSVSYLLSLCLLSFLILSFCHFVLLSLFQLPTEKSRRTRWWCGNRLRRSPSWRTSSRRRWRSRRPSRPARGSSGSNSSPTPTTRPRDSAYLMSPTMVSHSAQRFSILYAKDSAHRFSSYLAKGFGIPYARDSAYRTSPMTVFSIYRKNTRPGARLLVFPFSFLRYKSDADTSLNSASALKYLR